MPYPSNITAVGADPSPLSGNQPPAPVAPVAPTGPNAYAGPGRVGAVTFDDSATVAKPYAGPVPTPVQPTAPAVVPAPVPVSTGAPVQTSASGPVVQPLAQVAPTAATPAPAPQQPGIDNLSATPVQIQPQATSRPMVVPTAPVPAPLPSQVWQPPVPLVGDAAEVFAPMIAQQERQQQQQIEQQHWSEQNGWQNNRTQIQDNREEDYRQHLVDQEQQKLDMEKKQETNAAATEDQAETGRRYVMGPQGVKVPISDPATGKPLYAAAKLGETTDETTGRPTTQARNTDGTVTSTTNYKAWDADDSDTAQAAAKQDIQTGDLPTRINAAKYLHSKEVDQLAEHFDDVAAQLKEAPKPLKPELRTTLEQESKQLSTPIPPASEKDGVFGKVSPTQDEIDAAKQGEDARVEALAKVQKQLGDDDDRAALTQEAIATKQKLSDSKAGGPGGFLRRYQAGQAYLPSTDLAGGDEKKNDIAGTLNDLQSQQAGRDQQRQAIQSQIAGGLAGPDLDKANQQLSALDQSDKDAKPQADQLKQQSAIASTPPPQPQGPVAPYMDQPMSATQDFINNADRLLTKSLGPTLVAGAADLSTAVQQSWLNPGHWINKAVSALGGPDVEARQNADLSTLHAWQKTGEQNIDQAFPVDPSRQKTWARWTSDLVGNTLPMLAGPGRLKSAIDGYMALTGGEQAKEQLQDQGATGSAAGAAGVATGGVYALANHFLGPFTTSFLKYVPGAAETLAKKAINAVVGTAANAGRQGLELGAINGASSAIADTALAASGVKDTPENSPYQNPFKAAIDGFTTGAVLGGILTVPERAQVEVNNARVGTALKVAGAKAAFVQNTADAFLQIDQAKADGKMTDEQAEQAKHDTLHFLTPENQAQVAAHVDNVNAARVQGAQVLKASAAVTASLGAPDADYRHLTDDQVNASAQATPDDPKLALEADRRQKVQQIQSVTNQRLGEIADNLKDASAATEALAQQPGGAATLASLVEHNVTLPITQKIDARAYLPVDQMQALTDARLNDPQKAAATLTAQGQPTTAAEISAAQQLAGHSQNMPEHQEVAEQQHGARVEIEQHQKAGNKVGEMQARQKVVALEGKRKQGVLQRLAQNVKANREIRTLRDASDTAQKQREAYKAHPDKDVRDSADDNFAEAKQKANRTSGLAKISNGVHLSKLTAGELAAVGAVPDGTGGFKPAVGVADVAKDPTKELSPVTPSKAGTPIVTDEGARNLAKYAPETAKLIYDGETDAKTKADARADAAAEQESREQGKKNAGKNSGKEPAGGSWTARGDQGTEVSIPASKAGSQREAEPLLAQKLPKGELLDVGSVERPKVEKPTDDAKAAPYKNGNESEASTAGQAASAGKDGQRVGETVAPVGGVEGSAQPASGVSADQSSERAGGSGAGAEGSAAPEKATGGADLSKSERTGMPSGTGQGGAPRAKSLASGAIDQGVSRVKARLDALNRARGLTGNRAIQVEFTEDPAAGAMSASISADGKITLLLNRTSVEREANAHRFAVDKGDANRWLSDALNEEVTHLADLLTARDQWEAQSKPGMANDFWSEERRQNLASVKKAIAGGDKLVARAFVDSFRSYENRGHARPDNPLRNIKDDDINQVALKLLDHIDGTGIDVTHASEFIRQLIQAKNEGTLTETGYRGVAGRLLNWMKRVYDNLQQAAYESPELQAIISPIERVLEMADKEQAAPTSTQQPMSDEEIRAQDRARKDDLETALGERQNLLQAIKKIGGLPTTDEALQGELNNIKEAKNKGMMMHLFRKDAHPVDRVREALGEQGFHFDTPAEMLQAINDTVNSGKPIYGLHAGARDDMARAANESEKTLPQVSAQWRQELARVQLGEWKSSAPMQLGKPGRALLLSGFPDEPMIIRPSVLREKLEKHGFPMVRLTTLPEKLHQPVMVMDSDTEPGAKVVLMELQHDGKNLIAAIHFKETPEGTEISDLRSIHGKEPRAITAAIHANQVTYYDKKKSRDWLSRSSVGSPSQEGHLSPRAQSDSSSDAGAWPSSLSPREARLAGIQLGRTPNVKTDADARQLQSGRLYAGTRAQGENLNLGVYKNPGELPLTEKPESKEKNSTQINLPGSVAKRVTDYGKTIPESDLYKGEAGSDSYGPEYGREDKPHVTVHYGLEAQPEAVQKLVKDFGPIKLKLGKTSLFKNEKYDVLKVGVEGSDIHRLNGLLAKEYPVKSDFPDYQPHLTVAYLKKGEGDKYAGDDRFQGTEVPINQFVFSDKERNHVPVDLISDEGSKPGQLIMEHRDLAKTIASKYAIPGLERNDVVQEANKGLMRAARTYDASKGAKFTTYASRVIQNGLNDVFGKQVNVARHEEGGLDHPSQETGLTRQETTSGTVAPASQSIERAETKGVLDEEIRRLPKGPQAIVEGFRAGKNGQEIADELGITRQSVNASLKGALTIMRQRLKARGFEGQESGVLHAGTRGDVPDAGDMPGGTLIKPEDLKIDNSEPWGQKFDDHDSEDADTWPFKNSSQLDSYKQAVDAFDRNDPDTWDEFLPTKLAGEHANIVEQSEEMDALAQRLKDQEGIDPATAKAARDLAEAILKQGDVLGDRAEKNMEYANAVVERAQKMTEDYFAPSDDPDVSLSRADVDDDETWPEGWSDDMDAELEKHGVASDSFEKLGDEYHKQPGYKEAIEAFDKKHQTLIDAAKNRVAARSGPEQKTLFAGERGGNTREDYMAELMRQIQSDMPSQSEIKAMRDRALAEEPGKQTVGVPKKANYAGDKQTRRGIDAIQDLRESNREAETQQQWIDRARERVSREPDAVKTELLKKAFNPDIYGTLSPVDVKAAQLLVPRLMREAYASGDKAKIKEASTLAWSYDAAGADQARALASRRDPFKTPAERHIEFLTKMLATPGPRERVEIRNEADPEKRRELLDKVQAERLEKITKALGDMGVRLEDVFAGEARVSLKSSMLAQNALATLGDPARQRAARMIMDGFSDNQIAKQLGLKVNDVADLSGKFDQVLGERLADYFNRGFTPADLENMDASKLFAGTADGVRKVALSPEQLASMVKEGLRKFRPDADLRNSGKLQKRLKRRVDKSAPYQGKGPSDASIPDYEPMKQDQMKPGLSPEEQAEFNRSRRPSDAPSDATRYRQQQLDYDKEIPYEHVPFDPNNREQVFRVARAMQAADGNKFDMVYEAWVNSILSGPQTHVALSMGMAANAAWDFSVQRGIEALTNAAFFHDPNSAQFGEFKPMLKAVLPAISRALKFGAKVFNSEEHYAFERSVLNQQLEFKGANDNTGGHLPAIPGKLGRIIRIPARVVMFQDSFFKQVIGQMEASAQAYRLGKAQGLAGADLEKYIHGQVNLPGSDAWQRAVAKAEEGTFQTKLRSHAEGGGPAEGIARKVQDLRNGDASTWQGQVGEKMLGFLFPFIRTPYNIFRTGLSKTPLGAVAVGGRIANGLFALKDGKTFVDGYSKAQMVKDLATQSIAWATAAALYGMVEGDKDDENKQLLITGSRPHGVDKEGSRELANRVAGGPYQIRIGGRNGTYINYGRIEPFATVLGTVADAIRIAKQNQDLPTSIGKFGGYFMAQAQDKTFLQGISSVAEAVQTASQDPKNVAKGIERQFLQGLVPNLIRQPLRNLDDYERDSRNGSDLYSATALGGLAQKKYDLYGNAEEKQGSPLSRIGIRSGDVPYSTLQRGDQLLQNWNRVNPEQPYYPAREGNYSYKDATGKKIAITPEQISAFDQAAGKRFAAGMPGWLTPAMANSPTEGDIKMFREELERARKETREEMFGQGMTHARPQTGTDISSLMGWK